MKLTWTIQDEAESFPPDDVLYAFACTLPEHDWKNRPIHRVPDWAQFGIERFGNSCHVYTTDHMISDPQGVLKNKTVWRRVGLFTWGMNKYEAQQKYAG